jgi:hypothetical protein
MKILKEYYKISENNSITFVILYPIYTLSNSRCMNTICYNLLMIQDPSMLLLSMLVDRSRVCYIVVWSFHCVTNKVFRKKGSMQLDSAIGTLKFE